MFAGTIDSPAACTEQGGWHCASGFTALSGGGSHLSDAFLRRLRGQHESQSKTRTHPAHSCPWASLSKKTYVSMAAVDEHLSPSLVIPSHRLLIFILRGRRSLNTTQRFFMASSQRDSAPAPASAVRRSFWRSTIAGTSPDSLQGRAASCWRA